MKKIVRNSWLCIILLFAISSCSEDDLVIDESLAKAEFELPKGTPGSVDERIYNIYQKYGTYIFYKFTDDEMSYVWNGRWTRWHTPALTTDDKYINRVIDVIESTIFNKFEPEFVKCNFPYKVFIVDSLSKDYNKPTSASGLVNVSSNGQNAFAIANAGVKADKFSAADWKKMSVDLNATFTQNYFAGLPVKPVDFTASRWVGSTPIKDDPTGEDEKTNYSLWSIGYIAAWVGYVAPKEDQDYADFVAFLTGTPGTEIKRRLTKYSRLKDRALLLVPYLNNVVNLNVIGTQNLNCPDDKLPADYFDKLQ